MIDGCQSTEFLFQCSKHISYKVNIQNEVEAENTYRPFLPPVLPLIPLLGQGWEENVDAAMTHLLRTVLAKVPRDSVPALLSGQPPLEMPPDTKRLKKHISIVCDRLSKGASLTIRPAAPPSSPPHSPPLSAPLTFSQRAP